MRTHENRPFDYSAIPLGYYDKIAMRRKGIRSYWHHLKFKRIIDGLEGSCDAILDIGCFAGTFLGMIPKEKVRKQTGIDILEDQIEYANKNYGTDFRNFFTVNDFSEQDFLPEAHFDLITLIEVIEHLTLDQIRQIFDYSYLRLKSGGKMVITTPNYASMWPVLEIMLNSFSDVKYEEQHITRFNYFNARAKLRSIIKNFDNRFYIEYQTTTHLLTPLVAILSFSIAEKLSSAVSPEKWKIPLGSILIVQLSKK